MKNDITNLQKVYENLNMPRLYSLVKDTMEWLLDIEDFEEAEDSLNMELTQIGMGKESIAYIENGVVLKINDSENKDIWEKYIKLDCFAETEIYDAKFGMVILQEELTLDSVDYWDNDIRTEMENCIKKSGLPYDFTEITDENVGYDDNGVWKMFDIPVR